MIEVEVTVDGTRVHDTRLLCQSIRVLDLYLYIDSRVSSFLSPVLVILFIIRNLAGKKEF